MAVVLWPWPWKRSSECHLLLPLRLLSNQGWMILLQVSSSKKMKKSPPVPSKSIANFEGTTRRSSTGCKKKKSGASLSSLTPSRTRCKKMRNAEMKTTRAGARKPAMMTRDARKTRTREGAKTRIVTGAKRVERAARPEGAARLVEAGRAGRRYGAAAAAAARAVRAEDVAKVQREAVRREVNPRVPRVPPRLPLMLLLIDFRPRFFRR
mmetsp:Transcript_25384/g.54607  ORF Transcript_25384/g.54607 Transcript_25384/m.54607 type:complete len:209 (-) Transcript_25384:58-684(-)